MSRPALEVADIFREHGPAWRRANAGHVSLADFVKALDIDLARDGEVMIAYVMNGEDLPWLNGYPVRLVVPGYYGTYWVKHLERDHRDRYYLRRVLDEERLSHSRR